MRKTKASKLFFLWSIDRSIVALSIARCCLLVSWSKRHAHATLRVCGRLAGAFI